MEREWLRTRGDGTALGRDPYCLTSLTSNGNLSSERSEVSGGESNETVRRRDRQINSPLNIAETDGNSLHTKVGKQHLITILI